MNAGDFDDLAPWIAEWGLPDAHARLQLRAGKSLAELQAFHAAVVPRLEAIIAFLNRFALDAIPPEHEPLAWTALAVCEVDDAVNVWRAPVLAHADDPGRWRVKAHFQDQ